jgi:hypothetical protein
MAVTPDATAPAVSSPWYRADTDGHLPGRWRDHCRYPCHVCIAVCVGLVDPVTYSAVQTLDEIRANSMAQTSFVIVMLVIAGSVALLLGVVATSDCLYRVAADS